MLYRLYWRTFADFTVLRHMRVQRNLRVWVASSICIWRCVSPLLAGDLGRPLPPNVVIIYCDDLGYADIEPFGAPRTKTPNLVRLAAEGRKLTDFHVTSGVCSPSRASLMTGCYPKRVGLHQNESGGWVLFPGNRRGLNPSEVT